MTKKKKFKCIGYNTFERFIQYHKQIEIVSNINPKNILEIGIGNKTVSNYLKQNGFNVTTCDIDSGLNPDYVGDVRNLPFKDKSFDLIVACEILEHIPWEDFSRALSELYRVSNKYVVISLPYALANFEIIIKLPFLQLLLGKPYIDFFLKIPYFFKKHKLGGEHFWEIGKRGFPLSKIRNKFNVQFAIIDEIRLLYDQKHRFFVLKKKFH